MKFHLARDGVDCSNVSLPLLALWKIFFFGLIQKKKICVILLTDSVVFFFFLWLLFRPEKEEKCYRCLFIAQKHPNVLQYKECKSYDELRFLFFVRVCCVLCVIEDSPTESDPPSVSPHDVMVESHFMIVFDASWVVLWCVVVSWGHLLMSEEKMKPIRRRQRPGMGLGAVSLISDQHYMNTFFFPPPLVSCP